MRFQPAVNARGVYFCKVMVLNCHIRGKDNVLADALSRS